jgi:hypothetical protein
VETDAPTDSETDDGIADEGLVETRNARRRRLRRGVLVVGALGALGIGVAFVAILVDAPLADLDASCTDHDVRIKNRGSQSLSVAFTAAGVTPKGQKAAGIIPAYPESVATSWLAPGDEIVSSVRVPSEAVKACANVTRHPHGCTLGFHLFVGRDGHAPVRGLGMCAPRWDAPDAAPVPATRLRLVR